MADDNAPKKPTYEELERRVAEQERRIAELEEQSRKLVKALEEALRAGKRQAAPFSKGDPKPEPKKPGRKKGDGYGHWCARVRPEHVDETLEADLDPCCPSCGGHVDEICVAEQFQTELPRVKPIERVFRIHVGRCRDCGRRVQPRHALQTSDALGAAGVQLGPNAHSLAALLNKGYGLSHGKVASFFERVFGIRAQRSTFCRGAERLGHRFEPEYAEMTAELRFAPVVNADETGWKIGGMRAWLWNFVTRRFTVYRIARSRGGDVIESMLGDDFPGLIGRDGWAPYERLKQATHQSCLAHHLARAREIIEIAVRGAARFAHAVIRILKAALDLRDRRDEITAHGFEVATGRVEARMDRLLAWEPTYGPNAKFRKHLARERPHLFTFLRCPEIEATNWPAEQAIRPAVITRKNCGGGNRTQRGAYAQEVLMSIIRTCAQQARDTLELFARALCDPEWRSYGLAHGPP